MDDAEHKSSGWYPDASNPSLQRWWNGISWGDQTRPANGSSVPKVVPMSTPTFADPYATARPTPPRPSTPAAARGAKFSNVNPVGYAGVVLGFISIIFNFFGVLGILAIILSALGLRKSRQLAVAGRQVTGRNWCIAGLVIGIAETAIHVVATVK